MHPELIKAEIRMRGTTPAAIADEMGVCRAAVAQVINGKTKSARLRARIAQIVGKSEDVLWPDGAKGVPGLRRSKPSKVERGFAAGVRGQA